MIVVAEAQAVGRTLRCAALASAQWGASPRGVSVQIEEQNPAKVSAYTSRLEEATTQILEIPRLLLVELSASQSLRALALMKRAGLLPRDALHAMTALEIGLDAIITTDADCAQVEELAIYTCNDLLEKVGVHNRLP